MTDFSKSYEQLLQLLKSSVPGAEQLTLGQVNPPDAGPGSRDPKLKALSPESSEARKPQPPEELVGALQDRVHVAVGMVRPGRAVKVGRSEHDSD